jgi:hypothetical protein
MCWLAILTNNRDRETFLKLNLFPHGNVVNSIAPVSQVALDGSYQY